MIPLSPEGEDAWRRLLGHLRWTEDFALFVLFSDQDRTLLALRERVAALARAHVTQLGIFAWEQPEDLVERLLPRLLLPHELERALEGPLWVDVSAHASERDAAWRQARRTFLARLNERREQLKAAHPRPLILIWPARERGTFRELAPDLYAIRILALDVGDWAEVEATHQPTPLAATPPGPFPLGAEGERLVDEWTRVRLQADPGALRAGRRAFDELMSAGRLVEASEVAEATLGLARTLGDARDLSISLDNVGHAMEAQGRWSDAAANYQESLALSRALVARLGETPESLRDLSISINNVGRAMEAQGRWSDAAATYQESLALSRALVARLGETPENLRDLAICIQNVGDAANGAGARDDARRRYQEGLELARLLARALPELPDYRDLPRSFEVRLRALDAS